MRDRFIGAVIGFGLCAAAATAFAAQPKMHAALDYLRAARTALVNAKENKGGHRQKAIELVDKAIAQVQQGIEYARR
jgi:hypothetical protein